jgi:hypothetical protein
MAAKGVNAMNYNLSFGNYSGIFALPAQAADKYINEASQSDLKVLIYVFRHSGEPLDALQTCEALCLTPEQLRGSLDFWSGRGVFSCAVQKPETKANQTPDTKPQQEQKTTREQAAAHRVMDMPTQYGQEEIARKSQSNAEI